MTIGIMCAMPEEASRLAQELSREHVRIHGGREYHTGTLAGGGTLHRVVLVYSRIGKVAAAATAQHLIDIHRVEQILFTGVAGGLLPTLRTGDIVIARHLWQHDLDASPLFPAMEIPLLGVSAIAADATISQRLRTSAETFARDDFEHAVNASVRSDLALNRPAVIVGDIASGDRFVSTDAERALIRRRIPTAVCVEMEGAAVAQVCFEHGVPLGVVRVISDAADEQAAHDFARFTREAASVYGLSILRRYMLSA